jgi:hypothetical protein
MTTRQDLIREVEGGFQVMSEAGKPLGEPYATEEEARERLRQIEAAKAARGDSEGATVRRVDFLGEIHFDPERKDGVLAHVDASTGFLRADARLTRVGVFTYGDAEGNTWGELRTEDEVFNEDALRSFELSVLTDDHPQEFVSAANVKDVAIGTVGTDVRRDGDYMVASILVTDPLAIAKIRDGKVELSCGYTATVVQDSGVAGDGTPFAGRQTNIRGNHVALVDRGRAGPKCRLLVDAGDAYSIQPQPQEVPMTKKSKEDKGVAITVDGEEITVDAKVAARLKALEDAANKPAPETTPTPTTDDAEALRARVDFLETQAKADKASEAERIDARVSLVTTAKGILGAETSTRGVSDAALMRAVVLKVNPALEGRLDANKSSAGYLRAAYDAAVDRHAEGERAVADTNAALFNTITTGREDEDEDLDKIRDNYLANRKNIRLVAGGKE